MTCGQGGLSGIHRGGITFGGLGMQGQLDGSSVSNISESSLNEYGRGAGKAIFEGGLKFAASGARNKFDSIASADRREIGSDRGVRNRSISDN